nr:unnamed protein product [Callosobruchus chinensis]
MAYTNEEMADTHYVYGPSQANGLEASRRYVMKCILNGRILHTEYFPEFINDYENVVYSTKERRIGVAIEKVAFKKTLQSCCAFSSNLICWPKKQQRRDAAPFNCSNPSSEMHCNHLLRSDFRAEAIAQRFTNVSEHEIVNLQREDVI